MLCGREPPQVEPYRHDSKLSFSELIIPTMDSVRYTYLLSHLVKAEQHVLMTGPTGTGKTVNINEMLQKGLDDKYVPVCLAFSAQTSANMTQVRRPPRHSSKSSNRP